MILDAVHLIPDLKVRFLFWLLLCLFQFINIDFFLLSLKTMHSIENKALTASNIQKTCSITPKS